MPVSLMSLDNLCQSSFDMPGQVALAWRMPKEKAPSKNPCPSTGATRGACPGYQADHRIAICAGGADRAGNLQWLTVEQHKLKTKRDVMECRHPSDEGCV